MHQGYFTTTLQQMIYESVFNGKLISKDPVIDENALCLKIYKQV